MTRRDYGSGVIVARTSKRTKRTTYQAQFHAGQRRLTRTFRTRALASAWLREQRHARESGTLVAPVKLSVGDLLTEYLEQNLDLTHSSRQAYRHLIRLLAPLHRETAQTLQVVRINGCLNELRASGTASTTASRARSLLSAAYRWALKNELVARNPVEASKSIAKRPQVFEPWSANIAELFLQQSADWPLGGLWRCHLLSGLRTGEVRGLRWSDVDLDGGWLSVHGQIADGPKGQQYVPQTKTKRPRVVPIAPSLQRVLRDERDRQRLSGRHGPERYVWQGPDGDFIPIASARTAWYHDLERAGVPRIRLHDTRHAFASLIGRGGTDTKLIQVLLGHSSIATTGDIYRSAYSDELRAAVEQLDRAIGG